jgi:hypothetical protein
MVARRLRGSGLLLLLAATCLSSTVKVAGQDYSTRLAYGSWEDYASGGVGVPGAEHGRLPSLDDVSNNRTDRAVPIQKEWMVLAGYRPDLADPEPKLVPGGRLVKVEVRSRVLT